MFAPVQTPATSFWPASVNLLEGFTAKLSSNHDRCGFQWNKEVQVTVLKVNTSKQIMPYKSSQPFTFLFFSICYSRARGGGWRVGERRKERKEKDTVFLRLRIRITRLLNFYYKTLANFCSPWKRDVDNQTFGSNCPLNCQLLQETWNNAWNPCSYCSGNLSKIFTLRINTGFLLSKAIQIWRDNFRMWIEKEDLGSLRTQF